jgi:hypothetical protein
MESYDHPSRPESLCSFSARTSFRTEPKNSGGSEVEKKKDGHDAEVQQFHDRVCSNSADHLRHRMQRSGLVQQKHNPAYGNFRGASKCRRGRMP